ncbi:hypothetical protein V500_01025 [Pseudogymnoascus sp. VKM F-4518 (FW-2643)]|nr:hypothetical protein V500_01025 [Pseudogymnoascus sp. VKM F-4518 (FW-2643)]
MFVVDFLKVLLVLASVGGSHSSNNDPDHQIITYPIPAGVTTNPAFNISVKYPSGRWMDLQSYMVSLNEVNVTNGGSIGHSSSMAYFDFSGSVEVSVTYTRGRVNSARIRPNSYGIVPEIRGGNSLLFTLTKPQNLVVEVNDDIFDCVHLLSNSIETDAPSANDTNIIYFGPGLHTVPGNILQVPSDTTVYIAGGGVLNADIALQNVTNSGVRGHGVVYHSTNTILVEYSSNIAISDVIVLNPRWYSINAGQVDGLTINGVRSFSSAGNADGIDLFCSQNVLVNGVFMRNSDDNVAIYNHRNNWYGSTSNITVQNSVLWADQAHPINIGTHGNTQNPETMDGITIRNIDILDHREPQVDYQGCIALNPGDSNLLQNTYISDVRVEDFRQGQLINMRVMFNPTYNTSPGRGISNVTIKNLSYSGTHAAMAIMVGYDTERIISGVQFQNLTINGQVISDTMGKPAWFKTSDYVPMYANEHVVNLTFT